MAWPPTCRSRKLFIAGVMPGLAAGGAVHGLHRRLGAAATRTRIPPADERPRPSRQKLAESRHLIPVVLLIVAVLGSIYAGVATATEAAALGVVGALVVSRGAAAR